MTDLNDCAAIALKAVVGCNGQRMPLRDYLRKLLLTLWDEGECFSGKRPLGDSDWEYDIYTGLVAAGLVNGTIEDGYLDGFDNADRQYADKLVAAAIQLL